jgi:hypothetical protein
VALPLRDSAPLQAPEAVHEAALVVLQFNVDVLPAVTLAGEAVSETLGAAGGAVTVTVAVA